MSGKSARRKGKEYERLCEVQLKVLAAGGDLMIERRNRSGYDGEDIGIVTPNNTSVAVECKNQQAMTLSKWLDQAIEQAPLSNIPAVIHKRQGKAEVADHYLTMRVGDFMQLLEELA